MILATFTAGRVRGIVLFNCLLASVSTSLIVPFSLVIILTLSLRLTALLAFVPITTVLISTLITLFLPVLELALPHFPELIKAMFSSVGAFNTIGGGGRWFTPTFDSQRDVGSNHL